MPMVQENAIILTRNVTIIAGIIAGLLASDYSAFKELQLDHIRGSPHHYSCDNFIEVPTTLTPVGLAW